MNSQDKAASSDPPTLSSSSSYQSSESSGTPSVGRGDAQSPDKLTEWQQRQKTRIVDIYGVQLEVTNKLLEAETNKLRAIERELKQQISRKGKSAINGRKAEELRLNLRRIKEQCDQLEREYRDAATVAMKASNKFTGATRSQPAIGIKSTAKCRPCLFDTFEVPLTGGEEGQIGHGRSYKKKRLVYPQLSVSDMPAMSAIANGFHHHHKKEEAEETDTLVYEDTHLVSGSLDALIQHLVPTKTYHPERTYVFAFILTSRLSLRPYLLFQRVCQTCIYQQNLGSPYTTRETIGTFGGNMIRLLGEWTDNFPYDFRDEKMMQALKDMTQKLVTLNPDLRKDVGILMHNLFSKLASLQKYEDLLNRISCEVTNKLLNMTPNQPDIHDICSSPLVLAQQLTHIELERLSMIGPEEFVQAFAKSSDLKTPFEDLKPTTNLESYVQWFNRLSFFVATEICMHLKKKTRAKMVEYFIDVAKECINIGNFNSLMAVIAGLNLSYVQRLKKTWARVNKEKFEILEHQMDPKNNFGSYRSSLKACLWRFKGAVDQREKIVIPFFSLFVKDMYFLNECCASKLDNGHINFEKCWGLAKQISDFLTWKQVECPFDRHPTVLNYLLTNPVFSENSLQLASFECEPPDNNYEKEKYKVLKEQAGIS